MGFLYLGSFKTKINMDNITGLILTAIIGIIGVVKFKLIEELVKKITPDDQKARGFAILILFGTVVILSVMSLSLDSPLANDAGGQTQSVADQQATPKSDLEVKVDAVKEGIELTENLVQQAKENKRIKDSTFIANRSERWVYQIGDWTDDDDKILELHKLVPGNIKVLKQKKNYLFIREDNGSREDLEAAVNQLQADLQGVQVKVIDLNGFLSRRKNNFVERIERFGRRKKKIELECLVAD
jgi:hypothetical protein